MLAVSEHENDGPVVDGFERRAVGQPVDIVCHDRPEKKRAARWPPASRKADSLKSADWGIAASGLGGHGGQLLALGQGRLGIGLTFDGFGH